MDRNQALASALATFFKQIGLATVKASALLDRVPVFLAKDKKVFKFTKANKRVDELFCVLNVITLD